MNSIKSVLTNIMSGASKAANFISSNITLILVSIIGALGLAIKIKDNELASLKAKLDLAKTKEETDAIETEVQTKLQQANTAGQDASQIENLLKEIETKRKNIAGEPKQDPVEFFKDH